MAKTNSTNVAGPKAVPSFAVMSSPSFQAAMRAGGFDLWSVVLAIMMTYWRLRQTGQHGVVDLSLLAILPDGTPAEFDLPDVTI